jgi:RNA:NAD 2'-phosphotransferase (TPT1/KptA family)
VDTWTRAHIFLYKLKEGKGYKTSVDDKVICVKRTKKRIYLSSGVIIHLKEKNGMKYLASGGFIRNHRRYEYLQQVLRDVEGYLIYKIHNDKNRYKCW